MAIKTIQIDQLVDMNTVRIQAWDLFGQVVAQFPVWFWVLVGLGILLKGKEMIQLILGWSARWLGGSSVLR